MAKGSDLTADMIEKLRARDLKRMKLKDKDPRVNEQIDEIEEMTPPPPPPPPPPQRRRSRCSKKSPRKKIGKLRKGDELLSGRHQAGESLYRHEAQVVGGR